MSKITWDGEEYSWDGFEWTGKDTKRVHQLNDISDPESIGSWVPDRHYALAQQVAEIVGAEVVGRPQVTEAPPGRIY